MKPSDQSGENGISVKSGTSAGQSPSSLSEKPVFSTGEIICERYNVIRFIARGGMGEVYEVEDLELKTRIALKTIAPSRASSPRQVARFRQEIQLARKVGHPNVCRVFDLGRHKDETHGEVLFLTMELVPGHTLSEHLRQHGPMSCAQALPLIRQMVSALAAAHELGIVHRDFKPGNVMLLNEGTGPSLKITDFGLATNPELQETVSGSSPEVVGTPEYMPPEQFRGQCSTRTDVYALGVTAFQMVVGTVPASYEAPFKGLASTSSKSRAGSSASAQPAGKTPATGGGTGKRVPQRWREAITKSLAANPADRFDSVEEFWSALSGERVGRVVRDAIRRHRIAYAAIAFSLVVVVGLMLGGVIANPFRPLPKEKHLAVLPFLNIGNDPSNQAFAQGVSESLTSKLSQLERYQKSFWVVPASDARNIKSLDEAYRDLDVTLAVTGSIERTPDGVSLTADLVDPKNHRQLASRSMHLTSANLDEMQQRLWESVADMLDLQVSRQIKEELAAGATSQPEAYELYEQGNGYLQRGALDDLDQAIALFNKSLAKDPQYALAFAGLGVAYADKYALAKNPAWVAEATRDAGRAVELNDRLIPVRFSLARVYQQTGQLDKALAEYQRILEQDPTVVDAELRLGQTYQAQGKYTQAEATYKDAVARRSDYWPVYADLGSLYYAKGQFPQAVPEFQSVIDLAPGNPAGYYDLGGAYMAMGRYGDAVEVLKKGVALKPDADAWTDLGAAYMYLGKWEDATDAMKRAVDLNPHDHTLWRNLGDSYDQIPSRLDAAREAYAKALAAATEQFKVNPKDPTVLSGIALYHAHLGDKQEAEEFIDRALQVSANDSDTLFTSALVYEIIGNRDQALQALDKAVKAGFSLDEIEKEPELRKLQTDLRYQRWLAQTKKAKLGQQ